MIDSEFKEFHRLVFFALHTVNQSLQWICEKKFFSLNQFLDFQTH